MMFLFLSNRRQSHLPKTRWGVVEEKFEKGIECLEELHRAVG